jgi:putative nucleotidyltransferase with HDIG domain
MEDKIRELLPEIGLIRDEHLRGKTLRVYVKALEKGGWQPEDMEKIPFTLLIEDCPASYLQHVQGVTRVALGIAEGLERTYGDLMPINRDILICGALLHDVGKLVEYECDIDGCTFKAAHGKMLRHPFSGVGLCYDEGIPDEVMHMIAMHSKEGDGGRITNEAIIINHADFANFEPLHK